MDKTLIQLFEQGEAQIREELSSITLPKDSEKLTYFVNSFFTDKVQIDDYKKELTMAEITMVNSAIRLISLPLSIITTETFLKDAITLNSLNVKAEQPRCASSSNDFISKAANYTKPINWALLGTSTLFGGVFGGLIYKTWGGVLCTAAGCVLGMYSLYGINNVMSKNKSNAMTIQTPSKVLDVDVFVTLLKQVCAGIDDIIENYRLNIKQVLEQQSNTQNNPTLANSYKPLLDRMATMFVALKNQNLPDETKDEINKLYRSLKNQHYEIIDYSEDTRDLYVETTSPHVTSVTLIKAAILENGKLLEKGECLIPEC